MSECQHDKIGKVSGENFAIEFCLTCGMTQTEIDLRDEIALREDGCKNKCDLRQQFAAKEAQIVAMRNCKNCANYRGKNAFNYSKCQPCEGKNNWQWEGSVIRLIMVNNNTGKTLGEAQDKWLTAEAENVRLRNCFNCRRRYTVPVEGIPRTCPIAQLQSPRPCEKWARKEETP